MTTAAMVSDGKSEFWALVDQNGSPASPYARSKAEFELKLATAGMELTGKKIHPTEVGLPVWFCAEYRVKAFKVRRIDS